MATETYPDIVQTFYDDCEVVEISEDKSNLKGKCKRCKKAITGGWKPAKVTSNFISHVKVRIMCYTICDKLNVDIDDKLLMLNKLLMLRDRVHCYEPPVGSLWT